MNLPSNENIVVIIHLFWHLIATSEAVVAFWRIFVLVVLTQAVFLKLAIFVPCACNVEVVGNSPVDGNTSTWDNMSSVLFVQDACYSTQLCFIQRDKRSPTPNSSSLFFVIPSRFSSNNYFSNKINAGTLAHNQIIRIPEEHRHASAFENPWRPRVLRPHGACLQFAAQGTSKSCFSCHKWIRNLFELTKCSKNLTLHRYKIFRSGPEGEGKQLPFEFCFVSINQKLSD